MSSTEVKLGTTHLSQKSRRITPRKKCGEDTKKYPLHIARFLFDMTKELGAPQSPSTLCPRGLRRLVPKRPV